MASQYGSTEGVRILLYLWTSYLARILFLNDVATCFGNLLVLQRSLMGYNIVSKWQGFINVLESFSYKDSYSS
jgi:hypothetical protein